jgi:hypothetical protein
MHRRRYGYINHHSRVYPWRVYRQRQTLKRIGLLSLWERCVDWLCENEEHTRSSPKMQRV